MVPFTLLPDLSVTECDKCDGYGFFDYGDDDDPAPIGCLACGGTGEMDVCAGCGCIPTVINGVESCHCAIDWKVAA